MDLPQSFVHRIKKQFPSEAEEFLKSLNLPPRASVHLHPQKGSGLFKGMPNVPWYPQGRLLHERPFYTFDPAFHAGAYYPQESSSMFLGLILSKITHPPKSYVAVDLCAAPGGKSLIISSQLGKNGFLISNEVIRSRNKVLQENLIKWGKNGYVVTQNDPRDFASLPSFFDLVVVDAPCSGEGLFRKDEKARAEWSESSVDLCAARQARILEDISPAIKPGGHLVYSTCTFSSAENEANAQLLLDMGYRQVEIDLDEKWGIIKNQRGYQFLPHKVPGEGFFVAVFQKPGNPNDFESTLLPAKKKIKPQLIPESEFQSIREFADIEREDILKDRRGNYFHLSKKFLPVFEKLDKTLNVTLQGQPLGTLRGHLFLPDQGLATSAHTASNIPRLILTQEESLQYLRKNPLEIEAPFKGWGLAEYNGLPLGWLKAVPGRINNYYPKNWRVLKQ